MKELRHLVGLSPFGRHLARSLSVFGLLVDHHKLLFLLKYITCFEHFELCFQVTHLVGQLKLSHGHIFAREAALRTVALHEVHVGRALAVRLSLVTVGALHGGPTLRDYLGERVVLVEVGVFEVVDGCEVLEFLTENFGVSLLTLDHVRREGRLISIQNSQ